MGIGGSILLIAFGAILAFAVNADLGALDINVVGWILMLAGLAGLLLTTMLWQRRRTVVAAPPPAADPRVVPREQPVVEEYREVRRTDPPL